MVRKGRPAREVALKNERETLMKGLEKTADAYAAVDVGEIAKLEVDTAELIARKPDAAAILADQWSADLAHDFAIVSEYVRARNPLALILKHQGRQPARLNEIARVATALGSFAVGAAELGPMTSFSRDRLHALDAAIKEIEGMKVAVFGYLFAGKKLREIAGNCTMNARSNANIRIRTSPN